MCIADEYDVLRAQLSKEGGAPLNDLLYLRPARRVVERSNGVRAYDLQPPAAELTAEDVASVGRYPSGPSSIPS